MHVSAIPSCFFYWSLWVKCDVRVILKHSIKLISNDHHKEMFCDFIADYYFQKFDVQITERNEKLFSRRWKRSSVYFFYNWVHLGHRREYDTATISECNNNNNKNNSRQWVQLISWKFQLNLIKIFPPFCFQVYSQTIFPYFSTIIISLIIIKMHGILCAS